MRREAEGLTCAAALVAVGVVRVASPLLWQQASRMTPAQGRSCSCLMWAVRTWGHAHAAEPECCAAGFTPVCDVLCQA